MTELHQLPADFQLQIYDFFIALRTHQRKCRIDALCKKIIEGGLDIEGLGLDEYDELDVSKIPGLTELDVNDKDLPEVIRTGYNMINLVWGDAMDFGSATLTMCSMSLDDDKDVQVFRLNLQNDGWGSDALYDIHTFEKLGIINDDGPAGDGDHMLNVMKKSLEEVEPETQLEHYDEELDKYRQWLKDVSKTNFTNTAFSDEFTKMRSLLHERCVSRLSKKRDRDET